MYILAIDQGTTSTRALLIDKAGFIVDARQKEFKQYFPKAGWVEHDAMEIWQTVLDTVQPLLKNHGGHIKAIGVTNQRETTVLWDKRTGRPVHNAIVWQCRRTSNYCQSIKSKENLVREKTGLPIDAYFSGTKLKWLLENVDIPHPEDLAFGTIDTWLVWKLTKGSVHATDYTNASRTMLFNIKDKKWDLELCDLLSIPTAVLPTVKYSADDYGTVQSVPELTGVPITGIAGDQQAALFGQRCFNKGELKNTYGTGCFLLMNTGQDRIHSKHGLVTTIAADRAGKPCYALEGSVFIAGAAIQWLRDELKILDNATESEKMALSISDTDGVYFVPAFVGLGAPYWNSDARGLITGLTRGTTRAHIVRAALESLAFQSRDVVTAMINECQFTPKKLTVDGGATANNFLMQFQADILNIPVARPANRESTALGAAFLAGLYSGFWKSADELLALDKKETRFSPAMSKEKRDSLINGWETAVKRTIL